MLTSITQSRLSAARLQPVKKITTPLASNKKIPVFGDDVTEAVSVARPASTAAARIVATTAKITPRPNLSAAKNLTATKNATASSSSLARTLTTNKSLFSAASGASAGISTAKITGTATTKADAPATPPVSTAPTTPIDVISAALTDLGYDPKAFKIEPREEFVEYPGGGYWNRYTHVDMPNGASENYSTDLMLKYPSVTANEIKRLMGDSTTATIAKV